MYIAVFRTFSVLSANTKTPNFYYSLHHIVFSGCICYSFFIDNSSVLAAISFMPFWLLISGNERLWELYLSWKEEQQKEFLQFAASRPLEPVVKWGRSLRCPIICLNGTKPVSENALLIAVGRRMGTDVARTFGELEDIWNRYGVFGKMDDE